MIKKVLDEISVRIKKVREDMGHSPERMAGLFGITRSGYVKYESGDSYPRPQAMHTLSRDFNISLDWLITGKGSMYYEEKEQPEARSEAAKRVHAPRAETGKRPPGRVGPESTDVEELVCLMESIPLLRYRVLALFSEFKIERSDLVQATLNPPGDSE